MYRIYCDGFPIYDPMDEDLKVLSAKCRLEANTVCDGSFSILHSHPNYDVLKPLKSIIEIKQDERTIFRGRMTNDGRSFYKRLDVDLEGVLACANDTIIPPFTIEGRTLTWGDKSTTCAVDENVVEFFVRWILDRHNEHAQSWQQLKLGNVMVDAPDNALAIVSEEYISTWELMEKGLFGSSLGGYLYVRYEDDGNYVDYVTEFELTNDQHLTVGANVLDINTTLDAGATCSAILPIGKDGLTLKDMADRQLTDDEFKLFKLGNYIYSDTAVEKYGWICVALSDSKQDDITDAETLKEWAMEYLTGTASKYTNTIVIKAVDLSFSDAQISAVRPYRNVIVDAPTHGLEGEIYPLPKLEIDILNAQNTIITLGDTTRSLVDINRQQATSTQGQIKDTKNEVQKVNADITETVKEQSITQMTETITQCSQIIFSALEEYVETSNFEKYKETVATQLQILSDEILMNFTTVTEQITVVDGDIQNKFAEVYKHIRFADGNITLGSSENNITLTLENDMILFKKNGLQFGWWDGVDFHTGNIVVEVNERAQFGNFAFVPRSDGSLMFLKVGG